MRFELRLCDGDHDDGRVHDDGVHDGHVYDRACDRDDDDHARQVLNDGVPLYDQDSDQKQTQQFVCN